MRRPRCLLLGLDFACFPFFRKSLSTNAIKVNLDVPPVSSIGDKAQYLQNDPSSGWEISIYQDTKTQEDTTQINEFLPQFASLNSDLLSEFEDVVFDDIDQTNEFGQMPEELEQMAADVLQKLNEVVGEYRSIAAESAAY